MLVDFSKPNPEVEEKVLLPLAAELMRSLRKVQFHPHLPIVMCLGGLGTVSVSRFDGAIVEPLQLEFSKSLISVSFVDGLTSPAIVAQTRNEIALFSMILDTANSGNQISMVEAQTLISMEHLAPSFYQFGLRPNGISACRLVGSGLSIGIQVA